MCSKLVSSDLCFRVAYDEQAWFAERTEKFKKYGAEMQNARRLLGALLNNITRVRSHGIFIHLRRCEYVSLFLFAVLYVFV